MARVRDERRFVVAFDQTLKTGGDYRETVWATVREGRIVRPAWSCTGEIPDERDVRD